MSRIVWDNLASRRRSTCNRLIPYYTFIEPPLTSCSRTRRVVANEGEWLKRSCQRSVLSRSRCAACLARLPHTAMRHHLLPRFRERSAKIRVQTYPSHALMWAKSSSQTHLAIASPIGSNRDSGDRQSRIVRSSGRSPSGRNAMRLNISSRSRSAFRGPSSRIAFGPSGRPICSRTKPLNHSRKKRAWPATLSNSPADAWWINASSASAGTSPA
jgi:hypothetical protein